MKNRVGEKGAGLGPTLSSMEDRIRQMQSIIPGSDGGGSVLTPFKIGDFTFAAGGQVDLDVLAAISASVPIIYQPTTLNVDHGTDGSTTGVFSIDYNRMVDFSCTTILGSSPTVSTGPTWSIPLAPENSEYLHAVGNSIGYDLSGALQDFRTCLLTNQTVEPRYSTTTPALLQVSATAPITWVVGDRFYIRGRYRASESAA